MALHVTKSEERYKPITFLKNPRALWLTLADRAANWTPWVKKDDAGEGSMAGEFIQAVIMPLDQGDQNIAKLKEVLSAEHFALLQTQKAEKFDTAVKYTQADAKLFQSLATTPIGDGAIKVVHGKLAEKADTSMIPFVEQSQGEGRGEKSDKTGFKGEVQRYTEALGSTILAAVAEKGDVDAMEDKIETAIDTFTDQIMDSLDRLADRGEKSDRGPSLRDRLLHLLGRSGRDDTEKGDTTMDAVDEARVKEIATAAATSAAQATVDQLVEKVERERAEKADREQTEAQKAEQASTLKAVLAEVKELKAKVEKGDTGTDEMAEFKKQAEGLVKQVNGLVEKMDALQRSRGASSSQEKRAEKEDTTDPYSAFSSMFA